MKKAQKTRLLRVGSLAMAAALLTACGSGTSSSSSAAASESASEAESVSSEAETAAADGPGMSANPTIHGNLVIHTFVCPQIKRYQRF